MFRKLIKLSVWFAFINFITVAQADSFLLPVKASVCVDVMPDKPRSEIRYQTYDKAAFVAVKTSSYMRQKANELDDHSYDLWAYKLADKALNDISLITTKDDNEKICLNFSGKLDVQKADELFSREDIKTFKPQNVNEIANEVNTLLPKSLYETDETIPLIYVKELEFYNHNTTPAYTERITQKLSFEPRILVTESKELADYFLVPRLIQAKVEKIDEKNSKFSMSVSVELQNTAGVVIVSKQQNRYVIIADTEETQVIAGKLLIKLLENALDNLTGELNTLLKS